MGIVAWIVLGLAAGLLANILIPGRRSRGLILTCLTGITGAPLGGWAATRIFHLHHASVPPPSTTSCLPPPVRGRRALGTFSARETRAGHLGRPRARTHARIARPAAHRPDR